MHMQPVKPISHSARSANAKTRSQSHAGRDAGAPHVVPGREPRGANPDRNPDTPKPEEIAERLVRGLLGEAGVFLDRKL
jgi:hypothetical protein